ncbi:MAG: V-type ATP synthase subunit F [bacterium]|nr:V-type ATP synthase subunit F [bacterium]
MKEYDIAILGTPDSVLGFKGLGLDVFGVTTQEEGVESLKIIMESGKHAVLFITEDWAAKLEDQLDKFRGQALPAVLPIPSQKGATGEGSRNLSKIVEQAVGSDIIG